MGLADRKERRPARSRRSTRGSPEGWLAAGLAASITSFAVGMFTYDSLAFIQEAFVLWTLLALAAVLVGIHRETDVFPSETAV